MQTVEMIEGLDRSEAHDLDTFLCAGWGLIGEACGPVVNKGCAGVGAALWIDQFVDN
jgi:hypothetical protein